MEPGNETLARLRRFNGGVRSSDPLLAQESFDLEGGDRSRAARMRTEALELESAVSELAVMDEVMLESIILRRERPVLAIKNDQVELVFRDQEDSEIWKERLERSAPLLAAPIRAVGRIDLQGGRLEWVGTGWLIEEDILVTNRHVAAEFAMRKGSGFDFRIGENGRVGANTDFRREIDGLDDGAVTFQLVRPLHIEDAPGPDLAFFEIRRENGNGNLAKPIVRASRAHTTTHAATIGYPAYDSRIPDKALMEQLFGSIYDRKRFAPGAVTRIQGAHLLHNATTLGGNSGSAVLDLATGEVLGLHFSGSFLATNYAVCIEVVNKVLQNMRTSRSRSRVPARPTRPLVRSIERKTAVSAGAASITIPLTISVSLGQPSRQVKAVARQPAPPSTPEDLQSWDEAVVEDYRDREGYREDFLGEGFEVPLPIVEDEADILEVETTADNVLRYEHFSVVMSQSRRMCFYSGANVDGGLSKKSRRVGWKWDPRIAREQQIMKECYGTTPKFSRGHMTRREDPSWGSSAAEARRGNEDSMHVTNATPQMQAFNSPIWLALEDYALEHAREDDMRISVFTGPYFSDEDPEHYGVRIPVAFWKVIAFIHDETGELCATGYEMTQRDNLPTEEEFVFGQFVSLHLNTATQVPIHEIQARAGLDFGVLLDADPLAVEEETPGLARQALTEVQQIRFLV